MAVQAYRRTSGRDTPLGGQLSGLKDYSGRTKALLSALGDYWTAYYRDLEPLSHAATGSVAAVSAEYSRLLDYVLASNVLDVPISTPLQTDLLLFDEADLVPVPDAEGNLDHYRVDNTGLAGFTFLSSCLFESEVILERDRHFSVGEDGTLRLYVDLFHDPGITPYVYEVSGSTRRKMLLWATDVALDSTLIYERFGRFLYRKAKDSEQYKWLVTALLHFYTKEKSARKIENVLNILYGVPYARYADETVTGLYYVDAALNPLPHQAEAAFIGIRTDKTTYYTYAFSELRVEVGQRLSQFALLSSMHTVDDYITDPGWWERAGFPDQLLADDSGALTPEQKRELLGKILKYNLIYITLRASHATWETYVSQIREIQRIIGSGLPCYLTTLLNTVFRAAFADAVDMEDEFRILRALLGLLTRYEWRNPYRYDGAHAYAMLADPDHGSAGVERHAGYDGGAAYDHRERHQPGVDHVPPYDGAEDYHATWQIRHGWEQDELRILRVGLRAGDAWPWEAAASARLVQPRYDGGCEAGGGVLFGPSMVSFAAFRFNMRAAGFDDAFPPPADDGQSGFALRFAPLSDRYSAAAFQGCLAYDGAQAPSALNDALRWRSPALPDTVLRPEPWTDRDATPRFSGIAAYDGCRVAKDGPTDAFVLTVRHA